MMSKPANATQPELVELELDRHRTAAKIGETGSAWLALERAHILSQPDLPTHLRVHWTMLAYAVRLRDPVEVVGQLARLALAPIGALTGRIPVGNTGRSNVSAFRPMPIPADLRAALDPQARP